jgi:hypothetical protein
VRIRVFRGYHRTIDAVANGEVDFWRCGPSAYALAKKKNENVLLLAKHTAVGRPGVLIVRADSGIESLDDLKELVEKRKKQGRKVKVAFGSPVSGSGRVRIQAALAQAGIYADDVHWYYLGRHDNVAKAVFGPSDDEDLPKCDVGGLKWPVYEKFFGKDKTHPDACVDIASFGQVCKPWVAREGLDQWKVDETNVFDLLERCLKKLTKSRYEEFWSRYPEDIEDEYREEPPDDWPLALYAAEDGDYNEIRERQVESREFFNRLADYLIASDSDLKPAMKGQVQQKLDKLQLLDFDVLVLRHFKQMTDREIADELSIEQWEAHERYLRSLEGIKNVPSSPEEGDKEP